MIKPGGSLFINTSMIDQKATRADIGVYNVPVRELANELGNQRVANMVMLGAFIRKTGVVSVSSIEQVMRKTFDGKKAEMIPLNLEAIGRWSERTDNL